MNGWFNPDDWMDVVDHVLLILGAVSMTAIPSWFAVRNHKSIARVESQVVNGHKTPMRADLDKAILAIEALAHDVNGLRRDLADEEDRRRSHVRELREDFERKVTELNRRLG